MNDAVFSNFFGGVVQLSELSTPTHTMEHYNPVQSNGHCLDDEQAYLGCIGASLQPEQIVNPAMSATSLVTQKSAPDSSTSNANYCSIPFVQIHTTDLQQPEKSFQNVFRRKTAEIKSEPIKSEQSEASKERINTTPTPPTRNSSCTSIDDQCNSAETNGVLDSITQESVFPPLHKCLNCPFLSLSKIRAEAHLSNCFGKNGQERLRCPGCENIFYSKNSLNVHLSKDHLLEDHEISTILFALNKRYVNMNSSSSKTNASEKKTQEEQQYNLKSRIFIKNVDWLREPQPESLEPEDINSLVDCVNPDYSNNILDLFDTVAETPIEQTSHQKQTSTQETHAKNQKISIKSVDVLREPVMLPIDFPLPGNQTDIPLIPHTPLEVVDKELEKQRPPKIYIRNVDILKEPMLFPSSLNATNLQNTAFTDATTTPAQSNLSVFQNVSEHLPPTGPLPGLEHSLPVIANICAEPFPFESLVSANVNSATSVLDTFPVTSPNSSSTNMDNARFSALDLDFSAEFDYNVPLVTEPLAPNNDASSFCVTSNTLTPNKLSPQEEHNLFLDQQQQEIDRLPTSAQKQKIFIKNVDILKAPQFQQRHEHQHHHQQRGTLHLRTVDELNLMNRTEVERLIAPNPEHILDFHEPFSDFRTQLNNSWPSNGSYDLANDLDCIIINTMEPLLTVEGSIDSLLPGEPEVDSGAKSSPELETLTQMAEDILINDFSQLYTPQPQNVDMDCRHKHKFPAEFEKLPMNSLNVVGSVDTTSTTNSTFEVADVPPLVPVTSTVRTSETDVSSSSNLSCIAMPPLVPCLTNKQALPEFPSSEKQSRIYVANNLLSSTDVNNDPPVDPQLLTGGTSVRGRPYGAKRTGNTKVRKPTDSIDLQSGGKCTVTGCVFRFKSPATLEYHRRCHKGAVNSAQAMVCPECLSTEFSNWNSLHTHLWRTHQIDMELYSCHLCSFKTPIYSRLVNTHSKIHSEVRNYKCEQCGKAFKNTKQLKNHRRLHRTQGLGKIIETSPVTAPESASALHRCHDCSSAFTHLKTLREHLCKQRKERAQCELCQRIVSSKSSLRLHMLTHQTKKRFKCENCDYETNDHNAFRRHRATHQKQRMYTCTYCDYKAIQSTAFQIHIQQKHPDQASTILHKCAVCPYSTINAALLLVHQAKHGTYADDMLQKKTVSLDEALPENQSKVKLDSRIVTEHSNEHSKGLVTMRLSSDHEPL